MGMIDANTAAQLKQLFSGITNPVGLKLFKSDVGCRYCSHTHQLMEEVAGFSEHLKLEVFDMAEHKDLAEQYHIDRAPALVIQGAEDEGVRFYGIPAGHEFATIVEAVLDYGMGRGLDLADSTVKALGQVQKPMRIQVFVTPTCPYCPNAVRLAHKFARASKHIIGEGVEVSEFPDLIEKYSVQGVPKTVVNDAVEFVGAHPEESALQYVLEAAKIGG